MKKIASISGGLLLLLSTNVFAEDYAASALEHANSAVVHGKAGHAPVLVEHAKASLDQALAASIAAKGISKNHINAAAKELQESIDQGGLGQTDAATKHAEAAVEHLKASKNKS